MDLTVLTYLLYLAVALPLTFWVARTLHRYGKVFLIDVFDGDEVLAHAVNQLLVIGFYLLNLGYVAMFMTSHAEITSARRVFEILSAKVGGVALAIGAVHFANIWAFNALRRRAVLRARAVPPVTPNRYTPVAPSAAAPAAPPWPASTAWPGWPAPGPIPDAPPAPIA